MCKLQPRAIVFLRMLTFKKGNRVRRSLFSIYVAYINIYYIIILVFCEVFNFLYTSLKTSHPVRLESKELQSDGIKCKVRPNIGRTVLGIAEQCIIPNYNVFVY